MQLHLTLHILHYVMGMSVTYSPPQATGSYFKGEFFSIIFCWPCIFLQILAYDQLGALFHVFIYFIHLHVSSII